MKEATGTPGTLMVRAKRDLSILDADFFRPTRPLVPFTAEDAPKVCAYGTCFSLNRDVSWESIAKHGISLMDNDYICFVPHDIRPGEEIRGMRSDPTVAIYVNVKKALE
jgi:hypothetical protein